MRRWRKLGIILGPWGWFLILFESGSSLYYRSCSQRKISVMQFIGLVESWHFFATRMMSHCSRAQTEKAEKNGFEPNFRAAHPPKFLVLIRLRMRRRQDFIPKIIVYLWWWRDILEILSSGHRVECVPSVRHTAFQQSAIRHDHHFVPMRISHIGKNGESIKSEHFWPLGSLPDFLGFWVLSYNEFVDCWGLFLRLLWL